jgi:Tol biopolymer transport system component
VLRTITEFPGHAWIGRISPDGQQIVFNMPAHSVSFADDGDGWINTRGWNIWTMNVDGTNKRIIIKGAGAGRVTCWSPDGTKFIYYREDHPNAQLKRYRNFVFDIKSEQATRLEFPENESVWDWSPDGKELLTVTEFQEEPGRQMFHVNFDGSNRVRLGRPNRTNLWPRFSPDGQRVAFLSYNRHGGNICVVNRDGSRLFEVNHDDLLRPGAPVWSSDGQQLATLCNSRTPGPDNESSHDVFTLNANGSNVRRITSTPITQDSAMGLDWK